MKPLALLALFCILGCKAQRPVGAEIKGLVPLVSDPYGPGQEFWAGAIRDQKTLNRFFAQVNRTRKPGIPVPQIDFERELVLLIQLGTQKGNRSIQLSKVAETETQCTLAVEVMPPGTKDKDGEIHAGVILQPFFLYVMPFTDKTLNFERIDH